MNKTYQHIIFAAFALSAVACTQDEDFAPQTAQDEVRISATIATEVKTRVNSLGDGGVFENNDQILLVNESRTSKNVGTYIYNGSTWSLTDGMVVYSSTGTNNFTAYYPASAEFTLPADQSTEANIKSADRMTATATNVATGTAVELCFVRQNAKVTITPTFKNQYEGKTISDITDFKVGEVSPYLPQDGTAYTAILAPAENGFTVTLKVGEDELTATSSTVIEAGNHYTFSLTVGKDKAVIGNVKVEQWATTQISGVESDEIGVKVEYRDNATTAVFTVHELATAGMMQDAVAAAVGKNVTTLVFQDVVSEAQQGGIIPGIGSATNLTLDFQIMDGGTLIENVKNSTAHTVKYSYEVADDDTYEVYNLYGLQTWGNKARTTLNTGLTLKADIDEGTFEWTPVGTSAGAYSGTVDGGGHTIFGLKVGNGAAEANLGFMGCSSGTIKNIQLSDILIYGSLSESGSGGIGGVVGRNSGTVSCCMVLNGDVIGYHSVGGVVGVNTGTVNMCANMASVNAIRAFAGICGNNDGKVFASWTATTDEDGVGDVQQNGADGIGWNNDGTISVTKVFASEASVTQDDIDALNADKQDVSDYQWNWESGSWPALKKIEN